MNIRKIPIYEIVPGDQILLGVNSGGGAFKVSPITIVSVSKADYSTVYDVTYYVRSTLIIEQVDRSERVWKVFPDA